MRADTRGLGIAWTLMFAVGQAAAGQSALSGLVRNGGGAVDNAAVYLIPLDGQAHVAADQRTTIDQVHLNFVPNVAVISPGSEVSFMNSDEVLHNVFGPGLGGVDGFDLGTYPRNAQRSWTFEQEGLHVVLCHIHPEMAAFIIVADTPHKTLTASDGSFTLGGVEPGRYRLHAWHPRHWRNEQTEEVLVTEDDLTGLVIRLGRTGNEPLPRP